MLQALNLAYSIAAFAMLLLAGRFAVRALSFGRHEANPVYRLLRFLTSPSVRVARLLAPRVVKDAHLPLVAFLLLFWLCAGFAIGLPRLAGYA